MSVTRVGEGGERLSIKYKSVLIAKKNHLNGLATVMALCVHRQLQRPTYSVTCCREQVQLVIFVTLSFLLSFKFSFSLNVVALF